MAVAQAPVALAPYCSATSPLGSSSSCPLYVSGGTGGGGSGGTTVAGTVTDLGSTAVSGTTSTTIVPAATGTRWRATIYNTSSTIVWARADGGTAAVGTGIPIPAGGAYEWVYPLTGASPAPAINAIMATSTAGTISGEYVQ